MAYTIPIPFFCVKLHFHSGKTILTPLSDLQMMVMNESVLQLSARFKELYHKEVLNKGEFLQLLDVVNVGDYYKATINLEFEAARDKVSYPAFELEFDYFFKMSGDDYWAVVPALGIESFCPGGADLEKSIENVIRLEFLRKKRLSSVQKLIAAIWIDYSELLQHEILLKVPNLNNLNTGINENQENLLSKVAKKITIDRSVCYGRKKELEQFSRALKSSFNRNVLLVGPSGVGKTCLVWELAYQSKQRNIRGVFWETTASVLIKELTEDTGWEDNMAKLCQELSHRDDILFIRNLLELFEVGKYSGNEVSMADYIRPYISRGEVKLITECTEEELSRIELKNPNFTSFFQIIKIHEPGKELEEIIGKKIDDIAGLSKLSIEEEAIKETIRLNRRFMPYAGYPGKPIRFLESILLNRKGKNDNVGRLDIIENFCEETGMPRFVVDPEIPMDIDHIKSDFNHSVFGQEHAVDSITDLLASVKTSLTRAGKPIISLLFVGPTGVGKTEMAKVLAEFMFGSSNRMLRFDMSEFSDPWSVMRLTGESYFKDGLLTSAVRREPFSVLLFDEIEKAHPDFFDLLLQVLGEGRLTDSRGKLVNFCSTIIIMTSNIGAASAQNEKIGWRQTGVQEDTNIQYMSAVKKHFRPELFNRIDKVIPFNALSESVVRAVVEREIARLKKREGVDFRKMDLFIKEEVLDHLAIQGYHPKYGARQLQRVIHEELIIPLAHQLNLYDYDDQLVVEVSLKNSEIFLNIEADPLAIELLLEELDKINYADYASDLRRQVDRLQEGHSYIRLLSRLDILEAERKALKSDFWTNPQKSKQYSDNMEFKNRLESQSREIESFENELSLACLEQGTYNPSVIDRLKGWEEQFLHFKVDLLAHEDPESNRVYLAIYGSQLNEVLDIYLKIFKQKNFEYEAKTLWFREKYQKNTIANGIAGQNSNRQNHYIEQAWDGKMIFTPEKQEDLLYGIELIVSGSCIFYYLQEEEGVHHWKMSAQKDHLCVVRVENKQFDTPTNIHRKEFYKGSPRRIYSPNHVKDTKLKINREIDKNQFSDLITNTLDAQFITRLNNELH